MESSEDDAGTATSASSRASTREKDVELAEDIDATCNFQHELSETRASCGTPAMSEDYFDGDSIPSPSTKETSTEAVLDMIDDFIGSPRAPRRMPHMAQAADDLACGRATTPPIQSISVSVESKHNKQSEEHTEQIAMPPHELTPTVSAYRESLSENVLVQPAETACLLDTEILICANTATSDISHQSSASIQVDTVVNCSAQQPEIIQNVEQEILIGPPVIVPQLSSVEAVKDISDPSECENLERTLKCVSSSENRDNVTVELAESTSSECSVSESKTLSIEPTVSRSPLKRRLIRPAPSDRRPDSTVSSTVDSQTTDIHTTEQASSEIVTKDVSSSSDAVPNIHGITLPEEISNVSEISICKAETSTAPPRKVKLVRPKVTSVISNSVKVETQKISAILEKDQCQSTSSEDISTPSSAGFSVQTSIAVTAERSVKLESRLDLVSEDTTVKRQVQLSELSQDVSSNSQDVTINKSELQNVKNIETSEAQGTSLQHLSDNKLASASNTTTMTETQSLVAADIPAKTQLKQVNKQRSDSKSDDKIVNKENSSLNLCLSVTEPIESEDNKDVLESRCGSTDQDCTQSSSQDDKSISSQPLCQNIQEASVTANCSPDNNQLKDVNQCESDHKKVPPIKLNLSKSDQLKTSELPSSILNLNIAEDSETSHKFEELTKQVPKLTIKISSKYTEDSKSPKPKLTIKPLQPPTEQNLDDTDAIQRIPSVTKINIKPIPNLNEKDSISKKLNPHLEQNVDDSGTSKEICNVTKINIKPIPTEKGIENTSKSLQPDVKQNIDESDTNEQIQTITKINIRPIVKSNESASKSFHPVTEQVTDDTPNISKINTKLKHKHNEILNESALKSSLSAPEQNEDDHKFQQIPSVTKINIKPILKPNEKLTESIQTKPLQSDVERKIDDNSNQHIPNVTKINIKPILKPEIDTESASMTLYTPVKQYTDDSENNQQIPSITKINIKPIPKPPKNTNANISRPENLPIEITSRNEQIPNITKLNIKPIVKPPEKINEMHRKSSSSEISESEYSENDESTSTSDQASTSDQGPLDTVPKVTIKLGKPGTESEGKFYTEKNIPKLTIKNIHSDKDDKDLKSKLKTSLSDDNKVLEKVPKITIKNVSKSENQPLSPKLTIKPLKSPENVNKDNDIPKLKISSETYSLNAEVKENLHVPKITIKPVMKIDTDGTAKSPKKTVVCDSSEHIPMVTKLNIKPILKPTEIGESSENLSEKVPVVSKLNIKPIIKPKDSEVVSNIEDVPKMIKLNIKPLKNPEESSSEQKDCDEMNAEMKDSSIPVVTKLNIKPIVKPLEDKSLKDSENQSSETGNSSDENSDHIPIVTKINIKPIVKPSESEESTKPGQMEQCIPIVTKLNIKPVMKPEDHLSPSSPKKESFRSSGSGCIPVVTKLNIKPVIKPEDSHSKVQDEIFEKSSKHSLKMKINMKNVSDCLSENDNLCNNVALKAHSPKSSNAPKPAKHSPKVESNADRGLIPTSSWNVEIVKNIDCNPSSPSLLQTDCALPIDNSCEIKIVPENVQTTISNEVHSPSKDRSSSKPVCIDKAVPDNSVKESNTSEAFEQQFVDNKTKNIAINEVINEVNETNMKIAEHYNANYTKTSILNCTLLKKLLSSTKETDKNQETKSVNCLSQTEKPQPTLSNCKESRVNDERDPDLQRRHSPKLEKSNDLKHFTDSINLRSIEDVHREANESVTKPLEIMTDKTTNQDSGQDSPRIILKINKTDHGASAKIITDETNKSIVCTPANDSHASEHATETVSDIPSPKKHVINSRRKAAATKSPPNLTMGTRLRSSRIVETPEKSPAVKRNINKRPSTNDSVSPPQNKESELSILESKRMKLEQILSANKSLTITPVISKITQTSPSKSNAAINQGGKVSRNHSFLNNDNCSQKNGNSKLHNILTNLQAKQMQTLQLNETSGMEKTMEITTEIESNPSTGSSDVIVEITRVENCHPEVQEMLINENSICDLTGPEEVSQDPLEVESTKTLPEEVKETTTSVKTIELTPTPRKRGRPRKLPILDAVKSSPHTPLPVPALEQRPQRSLRLMRERPAILRKPRGGRGRGRGGRRAASPLPAPSPDPVVVVEVSDARASSPIDPTSSRIKLPRMTEALDKSVAGASCTTPLTSRRRSSAAQGDQKLFNSAVVLDSPVKSDEFMKSPEAGARPRSGRGSRGGRGRTPRNRGRGRGGGRGAMYMKETMGIYGRVCGPATTTVQLFEEETCMMDDNATPKPSHLLDEDSQSSVKSSTNDSNKMKKSKFADLFDSNKVWTAADVKEYMWPTPDTPNAEPQVMMIQEQVAMFLGVKSFKRRYPELKRRTVGGEEREYVLSKGVVSEALCDLGITAVDASEVLDIMLSDYPHKYEEYRSHQREKQIASTSVETVEVKTEERPTKVEIKSEKTSDKPEPPKVDPEKTRQDMAAAAIASAAEWNARANAWRRPACVDLQSNTIHRRRAPAPPPPPPGVCPPAGFYPHALLPGQFQHWYRTYTSEQLRYFPLNTVLAAPPAPPFPNDSSSESDASWGDHSSSSDDSDAPHHHSAKRKKLSRVKRSSQQEKEKEEPQAEVDTCRVCKLRLEANRKHTHERFLVCANCNAKLHPVCVELPADTIRKCREYPWQCAECKSCYACRRPQDDDKMLFCDLCDRGFHIYCVGLQAVPSGRWHCVECAICKSCGARDPNGLTQNTPSTPGPSTSGQSTPGQSTPGPPTPGPVTPGVSSGPGEWHHQTRRGPGGHKVYSHSLCTPCASKTKRGSNKT